MGHPADDLFEQRTQPMRGRFQSRMPANRKSGSWRDVGGIGVGEPLEFIYLHFGQGTPGIPPWRRVIR